MLTLVCLHGTKLKQLKVKINQVLKLKCSKYVSYLTAHVCQAS